MTGTGADSPSAVPPSKDNQPRATRAASGESSIYNGEAGRWHGYVATGLKESGRRYRRHVSGARRSDVVAKVRALEAKRDAGTAEAAGRAPTVGDWLEHIVPRRVRAHHERLWAPPSKGERPGQPGWS